MAIATALQLRPIHPLFGVEVGNVDLKHVDDDAFARLRAAFEEHSVLVFHDQRLTDEEQITFSIRFGPLEDTISGVARNTQMRPEIADLSNVDPDGNVIPGDDKRMVYHSGNQLWHTDSSFKRVPALASLLSGRECPPEGGETEFASMRAAHEGHRRAARRGVRRVERPLGGRGVGAQPAPCPDRDAPPGRGRSVLRVADPREAGPRLRLSGRGPG